MSKKQKPITQLVEDIFITPNHEIQCEQAQIQIVRVLSGAALLSELASRQQFPLLWHHFRFCPHCARDYKMLRELTRADAAGILDYPSHIPPPPDRASIWSRTKDAMSGLFPGFASTMSLALQRGESLGVEPAEVTLGDGEVTVFFDLEVNKSEPARRDLFCTVTSEEEALEEQLEGCSVCLQLGDEGPIVHENALDLFGEITFSGIQAGHYTWTLNLAGQVYAVLGLELP